jgi:hypothetical protein
MLTTNDSSKARAVNTPTHGQQHVKQDTSIAAVFLHSVIYLRYEFRVDNILRGCRDINHGADKPNQ